MKLMLNKCGLILAGLMAFSGAAIASEPYPTKAITIINTHSAGGPMDTVARLIAEGIREPQRRAQAAALTWWRSCSN